MAQIGLPLARADATPEEVLDEFHRRDETGSSDRAVESLVADAPAVQQAQAKLLQARRDVEQAELNFRYCDVVSEIDGVVTRRNVNPGNNVDAAQSLMAVRSIREIWIDANFKEGQLADLRIGQPVRCEVDMYGRRHEFEGRVTGFTMGTGETLSLLPAAERDRQLRQDRAAFAGPHRTDELRPRRAPLFMGLSVVPYVYYKEAPHGPDAATCYSRMHLCRSLPRVRPPARHELRAGTRIVRRLPWSSPADPRATWAHEHAGAGGCRAAGRQAVQSLARRDHRDAGDVHGGARHHCRERIAPLYRRRSGSFSGRGVVGVDNYWWQTRSCCRSPAGFRG